MSLLKRQVNRRRLLASSALAAGALSIGPPRFRHTGVAQDVQLRLRHDVAIGPLLQPYVDDFNERYPYELGTSYPPQDYFPTTQTQLAAGDVDFDVLFTDAGYNQLWYDNGWIRTLEDFPDIDEVLADIPESLHGSLRAADGTLMSLPYYQGYEVFCYNTAHLDEIGATVPETWDEFVETCRQLKADGVVSTPFSPFWGAEFSMVTFEFWTDFFSESTNPAFGENLEPLFASDPVATSTLERWRLLYEEELVPRDIFTTPYGDVVNIFGGGQSTFTARYTAQLVGWKDPEQSLAADQITNGVMPGATHGTVNFGGSWVMTTETENPEAAWDIMKYFAWKDLDGEYYFCKNFLAMDLGLATAYDAVNQDPEVRESWSSWADVDALDQQLAASVPLGPVTNTSWWREFVDLATPTIQDMTRGELEIEEGLSQLATFVDEQRSA